MSKRKVGIIGLGFIGMQHLDALLRVEGVEIVAVCEKYGDKAKKIASRYQIAHSYTDWHDLVEDPEVEVVHNCTPHAMHDEINRSVILLGKHIYSEKPLSMSSEAAREIWHLAREKGIAHGLNHQYRMNAPVQEMRSSILNGENGKPLFVFGQYLQESAAEATDYDGKMENTGIARVINDIGIHFIDTVCCVIHSPVTEVMADLSIHYPDRIDANGIRHSMTTEDTGTILLRFENGATGCLVTSKAAAGHMNDLQINVMCEKRSFTWKQEIPDRLLIGEKNIGFTEKYMLPQKVHDEVRPFITAPEGHVMGWPDALRNALSAYYRSIEDGTYLNEEQPYSTFRDGVLGMAFVEACVQSSREQRWIKVIQP